VDSLLAIFLARAFLPVLLHCLNNFVTPKILRQCNNTGKNARARNIANKESTIHTRFSSTLQSIPSMAPLLENIHKKISVMIADLTNSVATIQVNFSQEVEDVLKRVETVIMNSQDSSTISNQQQSSSEQINAKKSKKARQITGQENISKIYKILENNIAVKSTQPSGSTTAQPNTNIPNQEDLNRSSIIMQKMWLPNPNESTTLRNQKIQDDVFKVIEEIQGSLTVADREAILCTLMNAKENNRQLSEIRFDDIGSPRSRFNDSIRSMSSVTSPSLSIKYPADRFGQSFRSSIDYSAYDDNLPKDPKSRQIIANHLAQQRSQFQQSFVGKSMDIADARRFQDSYYQRDYFRNQPSSQMLSQQTSQPEDSLYSMSQVEGSVLRDFRERVHIENISPIRNANLLEQSLSVRQFPRITKEDFLDNKGVIRELVFSDVNPYSVSKEGYSGLTGDAMGLPERLEAPQVEDFRGYFAKQTPEEMNNNIEKLKGKNNTGNMEFCFKVCGTTKNKK